MAPAVAAALALHFRLGVQCDTLSTDLSSPLLCTLASVGERPRNLDKFNKTMVICVPRYVLHVLLLLVESVTVVVCRFRSMPLVIQGHRLHMTSAYDSVEYLTVVS